MHKYKRRGHSKPRSRTTTVALAIVAGIALAFFVGAATLAAPGGGKGKPAGGSGSGGTQILPQNLGSGPNCSRSSATGINNDVGYGLYVSATGRGCSSPGGGAALRWSQLTGMVDLGTLTAASDAFSQDVSDDGTVVGSTTGDVGLAFVRVAGATDMTALPLLPGMTWGTAEGVSGDGQFIIGTNSGSAGFQPVRWRRAGSTWMVDALGPVEPDWLLVPAIGNDGTGVLNPQAFGIGRAGRVAAAYVWDGTAGAWAALPGVDTVADDINAASNWIVGHRFASCPLTASCTKYPVPVYWVKNEHEWTGPFDLPALDNVDSRAYGVAERSGRRIIVGHGYTKKDAIRRAVYWLEQPDGSFRLARLAALAGRSKSWAEAQDVNNAGQIIGVSQANGLNSFAVMWTIP